MSAMSSTSMKGSATSPAGKATSPASTGSSRKDSLKFWAKKLERTIVHSAPESRIACSPRKAPASFRPESSTSRRTPCRTARSANDRVRSAAPVNARSGEYTTYTASTPERADAHVAESCQSKGGWPVREPIRIGTPRARSRSATLRPVLPVPPRIKVAW
jgi:hypothetical protein